MHWPRRSVFKASGLARQALRLMWAGCSDSPRCDPNFTPSHPCVDMFVLPAQPPRSLPTTRPARARARTHACAHAHMVEVVGNDSLTRELALSGRKLGADEALRAGFISRVCDDAASMKAAAIDLGATIASKSPVAVLGVKKCVFLKKRDGLPLSSLRSFTGSRSNRPVSHPCRSSQVQAMRSRPEQG